MMKKAIAILLSFLMIFQMLPMAAIAEGLQEDTGMLQPAESNDIEGVDVEEVFDEYIGDFGKRRAYVKPNVSKYIPLDVAVIEIRNARGIPILCHPYSYNFDEGQVIRLVKDFKFCGGMAMETLYATYTPGQQEQLKAYADEYGLMQSAASDFHGRGKKGSLANQFPISYAEHLLSIRKEDRKIKEQDG